MHWRQFRKANFFPFDTALVNAGYTRGMRQAIGWGMRNVFFYYRDGYECSFRSNRDLAALRKALAKKLNRAFVTRVSAQIRQRVDQFARTTEATFASKRKLTALLPKFCADATALFSIFQLPEYAQFLLPNTDQKLLVQFGLARDYAARILVANEKIYRPGLGRLLRMPKIQALMLLPSEVQHALQTGKFPANLPRRKTCVIKTINGKDGVLWNRAADVFYQKAFTADRTATSVHGQTAFPGKLTGIVYVALSDEQFRRIPHGAILVCSITRYDVVPYLKRVRAIVTDQGGITCHTAIIAREMKIPAVIGTRIATDVLKTGDRVGVDATCGVVRKLG